MNQPISKASAASVGILALSVGCLPVAVAKDVGDYLSYSVGKLSIQPQYDQTEVYTDNLFLSNGVNRVSELSSIFSPGVKLQYGSDSGNEMHFSASHDEFVLMNYPDKNTGQNRVAFDLKYSASRIRLEGKDSAAWMSTFIGGALNQTRTLVDRRVWNDDWRLSYDYSPKTDFYFLAHHLDTDYQSGLNLLDQADLKGTLGSSYQITPKYRLVAEGFYGLTTLNPNLAGAPKPSDSTVYGGYVGARGEFTRKLSGDLRVGYEQRDFNGGNSVGAQTPAISADLVYALGPKTAVTLAYYRNSAPSTQVAAQFQVTDVVSAMVSQGIGTTGKWQVRGTVRYQSSAFGAGPIPNFDQSRDDTSWMAGVSLYYQPRAWMTCSLGYDFENYSFQFRDAAAAKAYILPRYHANRITLAVAIGY